MNINSSSKPITFFGMDPQGNTISTNDSLEPLVGRGQLANLTNELVPYNSQISTIIGEGNGAQLPLRGIFVIGDSATSRLDGIGHRWVSGKELYLLNGWEKTGQSTIVFLYNPDMSAQADITLDWTADDGSVIDTYSGTLPSEGTLAQSLSTLFSSANDSLEGYLKVTSSTEICGFIAHATGQSIIAFPAQAATETDALYAPHFILLPDGTGSDLQVVNAGFNAASIVFTAIDDSGTEYPSQPMALEPGEMLKGPITDFVPLDPGSLSPTQILTGRIKAVITPTSGSGATPMILGGITLATGPDNSAGLPLEKEGWKETVFPHIAQSNALRIYTGLAIWNTSPYNSYVTVRARNQQGQVTAAKAFTLPSGQRKVNLLNEDVYFGGEFSQVGGHLEVISTQEIIAFCLYGDFDLVYLSTIGGQKVE